MLLKPRAMLCAPGVCITRGKQFRYVATQLFANLGFPGKAERPPFSL
jgi:hypothetical protein